MTGLKTIGPSEFRMLDPPPPPMFPLSVASVELLRITGLGRPDGSQSVGPQAPPAQLQNPPGGEGAPGAVVCRRPDSAKREGEEHVLPQQSACLRDSSSSRSFRRQNRCT